MRAKNEAPESHGFMGWVKRDFATPEIHQTIREAMPLIEPKKAA